MKKMIVSLSLLVVTACATPGGSTLLGTIGGAAAGTGIGLMVDAGPRGRERSQNTFAGATIGTLLGAGLGFLLEKKEAKEETVPSEKVKPEPSLTASEGQKTSGAPVLIPPKVDGKFVDDQVRGNLFVPGHFEYQVRPARWKKSGESVNE